MFAGHENLLVQVHPDVDSMEFHMKLIREHVEQAFAEFLEDTVGMQLYGAVGDSGLKMMRQLGGPAPLIAKPRGIGGFTRSAAEQAPATS